MRGRTTAVAVLGLLAYAGACSDGDHPISPAPELSLAAVEPIFAEGNPTCAPGFIELKVEPIDVGENVGSDGFLSVTITTSDDLYFDWTASAGVDQVIVKGGSNANLYNYDPEATSDTGLHAPINPSNQLPYGISHVSFCYDVELEVTKDAETSFTRTHDWDVQKDVAINQLTVAPGESYPLGYTVGVTYLGATDSDHMVWGSITVTNPHPSMAASVTGVSDVFDGQVGDVTLECPAFPVSLDPGASFQCTYSGSSDGTDGWNTATATSGTAGIGNGEGKAAVAFGDPATEVDACVTLDDSLTDMSGQAPVCALGITEPVQVLYTLDVVDILEITVEQCDQTVQILNTVSIFGDDEVEPLDAASETVDVLVVCDEPPPPPGDGTCTYTQGYWKNHSIHGPAPTDQSGAWESVGGPDAVFYGTGHSWLEVFRMPVKGNAAISLAHQYMAAKLNLAFGADPTSAVTDAIAAAEGYFTANGLAAPSKADRPDLIGWAGTLGAFNEGVIGPGHCDG